MLAVRLELARHAAKVLARPWQVFRCERCAAKVHSEIVPDWDGPGDLPPGWKLDIGFRASRILCGSCGGGDEERSPEAAKPVYAEIAHVTIEGDRGLVPSVCATCSRCEHQAESFGTSDRSVARCMILLRENCPLDQGNFYTDNPEGASTEPTAEEDLVDLDDVDPDEEHAPTLPRTMAALQAIQPEDREEALDELERAIPRIAKSILDRPSSFDIEDVDEIPF